MINLKFNNHYKKLGIVGNPVNHSLSPLIQNYMINQLGLEYIYLPYNIVKDDYHKFLSSAELLDIVGFNVTMPHKETAFLTCKKVFGDAEKAQSVNTVLRRNNSWEGYSTDGDGFNLSLLERNISFKDKKVLFIGAGGAASVLLLTANKNLAKSMTVLNRTLKTAINITKNYTIAKAFILDNESLNTHFKENDIIINCTPLGMSGVENNFTTFDFLNTEEKVLCDLIYSPMETLLLKKGKEKGHTVINGLDMLLYQGAISLELFTETKFDKIQMKNKIVKEFFNKL